MKFFCCSFIFEYLSKRFHGTDCGKYYFFICYTVENDDFKYTFINQSNTWSDAEQYCKSSYDGLAGIPVNGQVNSLLKLCDFPVCTVQRW